MIFRKGDYFRTRRGAPVEVISLANYPRILVRHDGVLRQTTEASLIESTTEAALADMLHRRPSRWSRFVTYLREEFGFARLTRREWMLALLGGAVILIGFILAGERVR